MDQRERLLEILGELTDEELRTFAFLLPDAIPGGKRRPDSRVDLAEVILQYYPEKALDVLDEVLNKIPRKDLVLKLRGEPRRGPSRYDRTEEREVAVAAAAAAAPSQLVSEGQLMRLATKMGKNWKKIGILFLGMEKSRLEYFEEDHPKDMTMQIFDMLCQWRNREKNQATARHLYNILSQEGVELDISACDVLLE